MFVCVKGFSVEGQENIQEILSKQLYLCQFLLAGLVIRPGELCSWFVCYCTMTSFLISLLFISMLHIWFFALHDIWFVNLLHIRFVNLHNILFVNLHHILFVNLHHI